MKVLQCVDVVCTLFFFSCSLYGMPQMRGETRFQLNE